MCRLYAQVSLAPRTAADLLLDSDKSLLKQSSAKRGCLQRDGWGIGWYDEKGRALVVKSAQPIYRERTALRKAAEQAKAKVVIAHVRAASNPLKLPPGRLLTPKNNQPFTDGRWLFAHNGTLSIPREVTKALGPLKNKLQAQNDSEVWFFIISWVAEMQAYDAVRDDELMADIMEKLQAIESREGLSADEAFELDDLTTPGDWKELNELLNHRLAELHDGALFTILRRNGEIDMADQFMNDRAGFERRREVGRLASLGPIPQTTPNAGGYPGLLE